ncbi:MULTISPECIES: enoyl-CoA hydratase/isomerase family protein [unclassified Pseudoalteromonas]|uniref:enoyl-CoA hydratase/isomerase family protein n=1 Tax=unclassified Pseudoalteromonas TaxID=194690 RepID=UPI0011084025|nr:MULTISPECIES: enoyl-CoA hydratase/isomerase family protein [unclassified Pseudoalteromonas]TMN82854.1 enoyl-CoA hydratase [Pseudoalteromonas sp. S410]TMN90354.1 enoyl-CoA hydratase [Pseudoalteromonas sp. S408]TMO00894.1 enoyl-CoA hydratase [Pseudoalteromonas sp. S407]TMO02011.1 enoyl-CoA hydratase [Pseudoalteromonas sp. S409]TMO09389.1 enoyl-CoA hydratase [Pseudoalteromonas sp. S186]
MSNLTLLNKADDSVLFETATAANGRLIGLITLNAPKSLNALNFNMIKLITPQLKAWANDDAIAMVILKGAGDKAFCAGGDVVSLYHAMAQGEPTSLVEDFFTQEYKLDYLIHTYAKPILVWGNGIVMGGGLGLMAGASHRVVTETSRIAMPEQTIGLYPDVGGSHFLHNMPKCVGLFLGLTSASINCDDACFVSLADHFIDSSLYNTMLNTILATSWATTASDNHTVLTNLLNQLNAQSADMPKGNVKANLDTIQQLGDLSTLQQQVDYLLNLNTDDKWLQRAQKSLKHGCPLSCALVSEQLKASKDKSLLDCFKMELGMSVRAGEVGEFQEGVRALLIDKDGAPNWQYKTLSDVPQTIIESFFANRFGENHPLDDLDTATQK